MKLSAFTLSLTSACLAAAAAGATLIQDDEPAKDGVVQRAIGALPPETQRQYFSMADANGSKWISFSEARATMRFDAARFRVFDTDNDGRLILKEFSEFVNREAAAGRTVRKPNIPAGLIKQPARDADQLRTAYDIDLDGAIGSFELERLLVDYQGNSGDRLDAATTLDRHDSDGSALRLEPPRGLMRAAILSSSSRSRTPEPSESCRSRVVAASRRSLEFPW